MSSGAIKKKKVHGNNSIQVKRKANGFKLFSSPCVIRDSGKSTDCDLTFYHSMLNMKRRSTWWGGDFIGAENIPFLGLNGDYGHWR